MNRTVRRLKLRVRGRARGARGLGEAGQALVEIAIALPILLALLVGIFEFARAYNVQQVITNAAREGAREGVLPTTVEAGALLRTTNRISDANIGNATVGYECIDRNSNGSCDTGDEVQVTVSVPYTFVFIGPVLSLFVSGDNDPGTINLRSTSTMRKE